MRRGEYGLVTLRSPGSGADGKKLLIMCYGGLMSNLCVLFFFFFIIVSEFEKDY